MSKYLNEHLINEAEITVYNAFKKNLNPNKYAIFPQICMRSILSSDYDDIYNIKWFILDYLICELPSYKPVLVLELEDLSHIKQNRVERDIKLHNCLNICGLPSFRICNFRNTIYDSDRLQDMIEYIIKMYNFEKLP